MNKTIAAIASALFLAMMLYYSGVIAKDNARRAAETEETLKKALMAKEAENARLTAQLRTLTKEDREMIIRNEQIQFVQDIATLIQFALSHGVLLTFGEAYRTQEQQEIYVKSGKSKTSNSNHLRRLAVDFNFFVDGRLTYDKATLQKIGDFWESLNPKNRWGGNFKNFLDTPHFERNVD